MKQMDNKQWRMYAYKNVDGTLELMLGANLCLVGLFPFLLSLPLGTTIFVDFLPVIMLALFLSVLWFKHRVTYARTGFIQPRRLNISSIALLVLGFLSLLFKPLLPDSLYLLNAGYPLLFGAFWSVYFLLLGQGLQRFYLYAAVALFAGIGALLAGFGSDFGTSLMALVMGTVLLVSGGRVLRRYLVQHPSPEHEA